jgi:hypothetical protein
MRQTIEIDIERLIVSGVAETDGLLIGAEIQRGLERLLLHHGIPAGLSQGGAAPYIDAGACQVQAGAAPEAIGAGIARQVYEGWKK